MPGRTVICNKAARIAAWKIVIVGIACAGVGIVGRFGYAQDSADNSYRELERSPITGWPSFYKPLKIHPRDQLFYAMGWCRTNHYKYKPSDLVVVDNLPEAVYEGRITAIGELAVAVTTNETVPRDFIVRLHPQATRLAVRGSAQLEALRSGLQVRFVGQLDGRGLPTSPVTSLELLAAAPVATLPEVGVGIETNIVGRIGRRDGQQLTITILTDRRRSIPVPLATGVAVTIEQNDLAWVNVGDFCKVRARVYQPPEDAKTELLATELEVKLASTTTGPARRRN